MKVIDLRVEPEGCEEHPLIKLKKMINEMGPGTKIKVITNEKVVPLKVIEILAKKKGAKFSSTKKDEFYEILIILP